MTFLLLLTGDQEDHIQTTKNWYSMSVSTKMLKGTVQ